MTTFCFVVDGMKLIGPCLWFNYNISLCRWRQCCLCTRSTGGTSPWQSTCPKRTTKPPKQLPASYVNSSEESQSADRLQTRQYQPFLQHHCVNWSEYTYFRWTIVGLLSTGLLATTASTVFLSNLTGLSVGYIVIWLTCSVSEQLIM